MATFIAKFEKIADEQKIIPQGLRGGDTKIYFDEIDLEDLGADLAVGDKIKLFKIPANLKILDLYVDSQSSGTAGALNIGTADADDVLGAAIDVSGAAKLAKLGPSAVFGSTLVAPASDKDNSIQIYATVSTAFTASSTGTLKVALIGFIE